MKKKFMLILLLISCIPLLGASLISYFLFTKSSLNDFYALTAGNAAALQAESQFYVNKHMGVVNAVSRTAPITAYDLPAAKRLLADFKKAYPDIDMVVSDNKGNQVVRGDDGALQKIPNHFFYKEAMSGKEEVVSEFLISQRNGQALVVLAMPVRGENGAVQGVLQANLYLDILKEFVTKLSVNGTTAYILDQTGKLMAHPTEKITPQERKDMSRVSFVQKALKGETGVEEYTDENGVRKLVNYAYDPKTRWVICVEKTYDEYNAKSYGLLLTSLAVLVVTIFVVIFISVFTSNRMSKPIEELVEATEGIRAGNLNVKLGNLGNDEIGKLAQNFNSMVSSLKELLSRVAMSSEAVSAASEELTACAQQSAATTEEVLTTITHISAGAGEQVKAANDAEAVVTRIADNMRKLAGNSVAVVDMSSKTAQSAASGGQSIEQAVQQMDSIESNVADSAQVVAKLGDRSKEIGQIVDTIAGIAGQTNLLALNAAIEAARAGEQGRGFAVVADEVRKLAEQSQNAAKQIALLISEIQADTDKAVVAMGKGSAEVKRGADMVSGAGKAFHEIIDMTNQVSGQIKDMAGEIENMAVDSRRIVAVVQNIDGMSRTTAEQIGGVSTNTGEQAAAIGEISRASQALVETAEKLQEAMKKFSL